MEQMQEPVEVNVYQNDQSGTVDNVPLFLEDELNFEENPDLQDLASFIPSLRKNRDPHAWTISMMHLLKDELM
jgi:hypothetical protein